MGLIKPATDLLDGQTCMQLLLTPRAAERAHTWSQVHELPCDRYSLPRYLVVSSAGVLRLVRVANSQVLYFFSISLSKLGHQTPHHAGRLEHVKTHNLETLALSNGSRAGKSICGVSAGNVGRFRNGCTPRGGVVRVDRYLSTELLSLSAWMVRHSHFSAGRTNRRFKFAVRTSSYNVTTCTSRFPR